MGSNAADVDSKAPDIAAVYIHKYNKAPDMNVVPKDVDIKEYLVSREDNIDIKKLETWWYTFFEASRLPNPKPLHSSNWTQTPTQAEEKSTQTMFTNTHRSTFINGEETNYEFDPWIWVSIY